MLLGNSIASRSMWGHTPNVWGPLLVADKTWAFTRTCAVFGRLVPQNDAFIFLERRTLHFHHFSFSASRDTLQHITRRKPTQPHLEPSENAHAISAWPHVSPACVLRRQHCKHRRIGATCHNNNNNVNNINKKSRLNVQEP